MQFRLSPDGAQLQVKHAYKSVVFDLFHTVVDDDDFRPKNYGRAKLVAQELDVDLQSFTSYWSDTLARRNTDRSQTVANLIKEYLSLRGKKFGEEIIAKVDSEMGRYQDMAILNPRPDVVSGLETLAQRGMKLGLLSNCDEREIRRWPDSPLAQRFDAACFSCDIGVTKPSLTAYAMVLERLKTLPQEAVYVGDGGSNELEGARKAGFGLVVFMDGFVANNGFRNPDELESLRRTADVVIHQVGELPKLL
jgi:putative hydrolase of the HAD superfamily